MPAAAVKDTKSCNVHLFRGKFLKPSPDLTKPERSRWWTHLKAIVCKDESRLSAVVGHIPPNRTVFVQELKLRRIMRSKVLASLIA